MRKAAALRAFMANQKRIPPRMQADGTRRFISVPSGRAMDLHCYLRSNRVRSAPPEPAFTGFDSIELAKGIDIDAIQTFLDAWT